MCSCYKIKTSETDVGRCNFYQLLLSAHDYLVSIPMRPVRKINKIPEFVILMTHDDVSSWKNFYISQSQQIISNFQQIDEMLFDPPIVNSKKIRWWGVKFRWRLCFKWGRTANLKLFLFSNQSSSWIPRDDYCFFPPEMQNPLRWFFYQSRLCQNINIDEPPMSQLSLWNCCYYRPFLSGHQHIWQNPHDSWLSCQKSTIATQSPHQ